jgi:uncharacterized protein (DUF302 family)
MAVTTAYAFGTSLKMSVAEARPQVEAALRAEGFGVLTEIDVAATMKAKLGIDGSPYLILGACNPPLAHRAIEAEPSVGALLPCNVVLRDEDGRTVIEAMDPLAVLGIVNLPEIEAVAREAHDRLVRVIALAQGHFHRRHTPRNRLLIADLRVVYSRQDVSARPRRAVS